MTTRIHQFGLSALALAVCMSLAACGKKDDAAPAASQATQTVQDPNLVSVREDMVTNFKVAAISTQILETEKDLPGRIDANETLVTRLGASVTGRVTDVLVDVGARVKPGQVLAKVTSPELTAAQLAYLRASSSTTQAERAVERAQLLIKADVIGSAEVQRREAELAIARAELRAAADQLRLLGIPEAQIRALRETGHLQSHAGVVANRSGIVIERKVSQGQVAQPGDQLFTIADLSNVWVVGALPEQDASAVQVGQKIEIKVPALGQREFNGKVVFVSDTISPETRTLMVRTQVDNSDLALKPQMLASLRVIGQGRDQLVIPESAVVRENDIDHVYVQTAATQFKLVPVELGAASQGLRPVFKGLNAGTPVVVEGAFHLNNERKRSQ